MTTTAAATPRIDHLTPGTAVVLEAAGVAETALFLGVEGTGDDRRARFESPSWVAETIDTDAGTYEWDAYRYRGGWVAGSSADRVKVLAVLA